MTDRDLRFVDEYLVDFDAKNAAIRAGYAPATARNAYAWINTENGATPTKPRVRAEIDRRMAAMSRRLGIKANRILNEAANVAFADILDVVDPQTGKLLPNISREDSAAICSYRIRKGEGWTEYEVRMHDKLKAQDMLFKYNNMYKENINITGPLPVIVDDCDGGQK